MLWMLCVLALMPFSDAGEMSVTDRVAAGNAAVRSGDYEKAIAHLAQVYDLIGVADGRQLAGSYYNLACAHSLMGNLDQALDILEAIQPLQPVSPAHMKQDKDLEPLRQRPRFQKMLAEMEAGSALNGRIFKNLRSPVPFSETLSLEDRLMGLSEVWASARNAFIYFDQVPDLDWDAAYRDAMSEVIAAEHTGAYYRVLTKLVAKLKDSHTDVSLPDELDSQYSARLPVRSGWIEGQAVITEVHDEALTEAGVKPGDAVLSIDGEAVEAYAAREIAPYVGSSTEQDRLENIYNYDLFRGAADSVIRLEMKRPSGETYQVEAKRRLWGPRRPDVTHKILPDNIGYLAINTFGNNTIWKQVKAGMDALQDTDALIIDIRENGGGNSGWWVNGFLSDTYRTTSWSARTLVPVYAVWGRNQPTVGTKSLTLPSSEKTRYTKPVALLISSRTFSAAEDFAASFKDLKRGKIIGEATGGSTGQPFHIQLPGGGWARFCAKRDVMPNGELFVGVGVQPDITVNRTVAALAQGEDIVLNKAKALLKAEMAQ